MGNGVSNYNRSIFVDIHGRTEKVTFSRHSSPKDIQEIIALAAGASSWTGVLLKDKNGSLIAINPAITVNTQESPYKVQIVDHRSTRHIPDNAEMIQTVICQVAEQFNKVFKTEELKDEMSKRMSALEKRMEKEGLKVVEIERCRKDISDLRNQLHDNKRFFENHRIGSPLSDDRKVGYIQDIPTYPKYILSQETIDYLKKPTFDIWHWESNEMLSLLEHMYHELGLVHEFNMNPITLKRWLLMVQSSYRNNPFHNFRHCFCVTQMMYGMIHLCRLQDKMSRFNMGLLITACVCHDLDHPGYNNAYQINARTELAIRYNDQSPLENHHAAVCFQILSQPECNIFANVAEDQFTKIRVGIIALILATDMARHAEILDKFKQNVDHFDWTNEDHITSPLYQISGTGNSSQCRQYVRELFATDFSLQSSSCPFNDEADGCSLANKPNNFFRGRLLASGGFFFDVRNLQRLSKNVFVSDSGFDAAERRVAIREYCQTSLPSIATLVNQSGIKLKYALRACFDSTYTDVILSDLYSLNDEALRKTVFSRSVNGDDVNWTLGWALISSTGNQTSSVAGHPNSCYFWCITAGITFLSFSWSHYF